MPRNVIGIRTNTWSLMEERLYFVLSQFFSKDEIFIIVDECEKQVPIPNHLNKISWNLDFVQQSQLLNYNHHNKGLGWLCGDYFYYIFQQKVLADYYWLIEPDVLLSFENIKDFFQEFTYSQADGIFVNMKKLPQDHYWYNSSLFIYNQEPMICSFPLNRLSYRAISVCKSERVRISQLFSQHQAFSFDKNPLRVAFPNDEVLVLNTLRKEHYLIDSFESKFPNSFEFFGYHQWFSVPQSQASPFSNQVIHPARTNDKITNNLIEQIFSSKEIKSILSSHIITEDNINAIASQLGTLFTDHCTEILQENLLGIQKLQQIKESIEDFLNPEISPFSINLIREDNSLILDFVLPDKIVSLIFQYQRGYIYCYAMERFVSTGWINRFNGFPYKDNKIILFDISISQSIEPALKKAIQVFYAHI